MGSINIKLIQHHKLIRKQRTSLTEPIGSLLKCQRKKLSMTLEETATDICSISYLSKVENDQIAPSKDYLELLFSKLELNEDLVLNSNYYELMERVVEAFIFRRALVNDRKGHTCYQEMLINLGNEIINYQIHFANATVTQLIDYIKNFNDYEATYYFYCVAILLKRESRYQEAFDLLKDLNLNVLNSDNLIAIIKFERLCLAFTIQQYFYISQNYQKEIEILLNSGLYHLVEELKLHYYLYFLSFTSRDKLSLEISQTFSKNNNYYKIILGTILYNQEKYQECYETIKEVDEPSFERHLKLLKLYSIDQLGMYNLLKTIQINFKGLESDVRVLISYLTIKSHHSRSDQIKHLRREIIYGEHLSADYLMLNYWRKEVIRIFREANNYKDLVYFLERIIQLKDKILKQ